MRALLCTLVPCCRVKADLNRNFPDPVHQAGSAAHLCLPRSTDSHPPAAWSLLQKGKDLRQPTGNEQPETLAIMNFTLSHR